ncbi:dihydroneopterin aldolase [Blattabacterium punctulatus]|uniref:7,8-dihydroneopterin aldolase n=1 Tax=Blattabacterium punctulatus TaxID=164514 RepID=A0ABM6WML7_9FLAO|nr:dihydroneopterin aldolase [Blattabacterium punctulatus]AWU39831.1 dihydroneopterin aldolase [Blattabacterium punctulatus]AWU40375.1 dihydroneopterin aldolase [Blattabacterium punctulatus]AWU42630.1 dihydroneopterin aldolase [Blattabacterium punctulatus]AWU43174.1 dihydroneopterin aldolase [Blattabacterium punctulatus]AWU44829.1 dihydroneopterin aldolase [Blattabacterium punctulatus]
MGKIILENIKLFGFHGCIPEESFLGSYYTVNIEVELDFHKASISDDLSKTIDYVYLFRVVKEEMAINSKLLENLAYRIIKRIKKYRIDLIKKTKIKICKENPPMESSVDRFCIILDDIN